MFITFIALHFLFQTCTSQNSENDPFEPQQRCTAVVAGRLATIDGSTMNMNTIDCHQCDFRLAKVHARNYSKHDKFAVYSARGEYPRYVGSERGPAFEKQYLDKGFVNWNETEPIAYLEQVHHTYSYYDGAYAFVNEHQLFISESTCAAKLMAKSIDDGGRAFFHIGELIRLALERTKTARDAILLMGEAATHRGFYGSEYVYGEAGETLAISDPNEVWIFHILADDTGGSAVWAAQRVPDNHVSVINNLFCIHQIDFNDDENFLHSDNVIEVATRAKLFKPSAGVEFDFTAAYSLGDNKSNPFDDKRRWYWYDQLAPSLHISPYHYQYDYPFSVPVDKKVGVEVFFSLLRNHYEHTPFDMTQDVLAGPWGNPWRQRLPSGYVHSGNFQRPTSLRRTSFSWLGQSRNWLPHQIGGLLWFSMHEPSTSVYIPFYPAVSEIPWTFSVGSLYSYNTLSAWWAFATTAGWADRFYSLIFEDIKAKQEELEKEGLEGVKQLETVVSHLLAADNSTKSWIRINNVINSFTTRHSVNVVESWWKLLSFLIVSYRDGYHVTDAQLHKDKISPSLLSYPKEWLEKINYKSIPNYIVAPGEDHPYPADKNPILVFNTPTTTTTSSVYQVQHEDELPKHFLRNALWETLAFSSILLFPLIFIFGIFIGSYVQRKFHRSQYMQIGDHGE